MHIVLETSRLTLRRFTEDDVDNLLDRNSAPEGMCYGEVTYGLTRSGGQAGHEGMS